MEEIPRKIIRGYCSSREPCPSRLGKIPVGNGGRSLGRGCSWMKPCIPIISCIRRGISSGLDAPARRWSRDINSRFSRNCSINTSERLEEGKDRTAFTPHLDISPCFWKKTKRECSIEDSVGVFFTLSFIPCRQRLVILSSAMTPKSMEKRMSRKCGRYNLQLLLLSLHSS